MRTLILVAISACFTLAPSVSLANKFCDTLMEFAIVKTESSDYTQTSSVVYSALQTIYDQSSTFEEFDKKSSDSGISGSYKLFKAAYKNQTGREYSKKEYENIFESLSQESFSEYFATSQSNRYQDNLAQGLEAAVVNCSELPSSSVVGYLDSENVFRLSLRTKGFESDERTITAVNSVPSNLVKCPAMKNRTIGRFQASEFVCSRTKNELVAIQVSMGKTGGLQNDLTVKIPELRFGNPYQRTGPLWSAELNPNDNIACSTKVISDVNAAASGSWAMQNGKLVGQATGEAGFIALVCTFTADGFIGKVQTSFPQASVLYPSNGRDGGPEGTAGSGGYSAVLLPSNGISDSLLKDIVQKSTDDGELLIPHIRKEEKMRTVDYQEQLVTTTLTYPSRFFTMIVYFRDAWGPGPKYNDPILSFEGGITIQEVRK